MKVGQAIQSPKPLHRRKRKDLGIVFIETSKNEEEAVAHVAIATVCPFPFESELRQTRRIASFYDVFKGVLGDFAESHSETIEAS